MNLSDAEIIHQRLIEEYCDKHPDLANQVRAGMMPDDLSAEVLAWMRGRLREMGYPPELIKLNRVVEPPAGIRLRHAKGLIVDDSDIEMAKGLSAIDAAHIQDSSITRTKIRVPQPVGIAESLSNQLLLAKDGEIPVEIRLHREGIVITAKQLQDHQKALPAHIVVCDIRSVQDGKLVTTRELHSSAGTFMYDAIQLVRAPHIQGDLHYGEEGVWWILNPSNGRQCLRMFWPDRRNRPAVELRPGAYVAELRIWIGTRNIPFQAAWRIDSEQKVTISGWTTHD